MNSNEETFTVWVSLEDWDRNNFLVKPDELNGEKIFRILTEDKSLAIIYKTFENTWECLEGEFTLQDSEILGDEIERYSSK